jgi:hypothetical protein
MPKIECIAGAQTRPLGSGFRALGWLLDLVLRTTMVGLVAAVVRAGPDDPRYRDKGVAPRFVAFGLPATLFVPVVWLLHRRRRGRYPVWVDDLYLSILALDLAGNVLGLYDRYSHFDLIPHAHGTGAATVVIAEMWDVSVGRAAVLATLGHVLLEAQEIASDRVFGLRNVRGWWDTAGDLAAGAVGTLSYGLAYQSRPATPGRRRR